MTLKSYILFFLILFGGFFSPVKAQDQLLAKAKHAYRHFDYGKALEFFEQSPDVANDKNSLQERAICYYKTNQLNNALEDLARSVQLGNKDPEIAWYMARAHHHQENYKDAIRYYKEYINNTGTRSDHYTRAHIEIKNCLFSSAQIRELEDGKALVQRFDDNINSEYDEITPVQSPSFGNVFYLSTNRNKKEFLIRSCSIDTTGQWNIINNSAQLFESYSNAIIQDISKNGRSLLFTIQQPGSDKYKYLFTYMDSIGNEYLIPLDDRVFDKVTDIQIVNNNTLAFASKEFKGFGGYDIYTIQYANRSWTSPLNAGAHINGPGNERSPCYSSDMTTVYFSSDRAYAYGGYDLYVHKQGQISYNLGPDVNSTANELHLRIDKDGHMAVFSSDRKSGKGGYDLYFLYLQNPEPVLNKTESDFSYVTDNLSSINIVNPVANDTNDTLDEITADSTITESAEVFQADTEIVLDYPNCIFYEDSYDLGNKINKNKLWLASQKIQSEKLKVLLQAHTDQNEPGLAEYVQYTCLKRALAVSEILVGFGVHSDSIIIESMANNYPLIRNNAAGKDLDSLQFMNKRVELMYYSYDEAKTNFNNSSFLEIPDHFRNRTHQIFELVQDGLYYSVQISETDRMYKNASLRLYNDVFVRRNTASGMNEYYIGIYTKLDDALKAKETLASSNVEMSDIVAFKDRIKLDKQALKKLLTSHPELAPLIK